MKIKREIKLATRCKYTFTKMKMKIKFATGTLAPFALFDHNAYE